ncbi:MAG: hypothetical protein HY754_13265, partial [Nitrospirae bacterium]|nr:hypothetical protein [Nitrospirota bacterium]
MPSRKIFIAIFLSSFSALAFEITLTRIFSVSLWYHFAFMVISIAMLGIGVSGTLLTVYPKLKNLSNIGIYGLLLGVSISLCYIASNRIPFDPVRLSWDRMQLFYISLYYIALSMPFFFAGLIVGTAFSNMSERSGIIYGSDLSGAGLGSITILFLMYILPLEMIVFVLSSIALMGSFVVGGKRIKTMSSILIVINIFILVKGPDIIGLRMSPYKGLQIALQFPGAERMKTYFSPFSQLDIFKSPAVRFAPGLSLKYLEPLPEQTGISIDGGDVNAITYAGDKKSLEFLGYLPSSLPYKIINPPPPYPPLAKGGIWGGDVLIIEPKGGLQALMAEYYGSKTFIKIESDPLLIKIIADEFRDFSGGIYNTNTFSGLGRSWLRTKKERFDIIDIPLTGTSTSASFGISEDYRFTVEAFKEYLNHLKPDGFLSITLFILPPPRIELRLLNTIIAAMKDMGIKEVGKHIAAIRSWGTISILVKKSELFPKDVEKIKRFSRERRFDLVYYPDIKQDETNIYVKMPSDEYCSAFKNLLTPESEQPFINNYIFDIKPVYDIKPFFNYFLRIKNIKPIYEIMGRKWQYFIEEGYLLIAVFIQVSVLSVIIIFAPISALLKVKLKVGFLPYFALLGIGFMFIEIPLIQMMILPIGNPSYAISLVITSILITSAIGSFLSQRFPKMRSPYIPILISFVVITFSFIAPFISSRIASHPLYPRMILIFLILLPVGIFMGIPFPLGLRILGEKEPRLIPWAWAINGCFSVIAPILAIMLAIEIGFTAVLWFGGTTYIIAFVMLKIFI